MPIYEYRCTQCNETIEVMQKLSDPPLSTCRACSGSLVRVISPSGLIFKGSGWYITDYSDKGKERRRREQEAQKGEGKGEAAKSASGEKAQAASGG